MTETAALLAAGDRRASNAREQQLFLSRSRALERIRCRERPTHRSDPYRRPGAIVLQLQDQHILQKLNLHSVPEVILYAVRKGLMP